MKRSVLVAVMLATSSTFADIVLTNQVVTTTTRPVMTVVTNTMTVTNVKAVWSNFSVSYAPPAYTACFYSVTYHLQELKTKREIPGSRVTVRMTEKQVADFAVSKGIDFPQMGLGIGGLLNEYLKTQFAQPPPARTRTIEEQ